MSSSFTKKNGVRFWCKKHLFFFRFLLKENGFENEFKIVDGFLLILGSYMEMIN